MNPIEERKARRDAMAALRAKPPAATGDAAGSNIVQFTAKPAPAAPAAPADDAGEGARQLDDVINKNDPENQTAEQKKAAGIVQSWLNFAKDFDAFRDAEDAFYIFHERDAVSLKFTRCNDILRAVARADYVKLNKDSLEQIQSILRCNALAKPCRPVNRRIAMDGEAHLIDLADPGRHQARVDQRGVTIVQSGVAIFSREKGYGELPMPVIPTDVAQAWGFLDPLLLPVPEADREPLVAVMVEWLKSNSPHPILILIGQEGTGKSTLAGRITMVIDPSVGKPPRVLHTERAFYSTAQSRHIMLMDNLSAHLKGKLEDHMCCSSDGRPIEVPELYTTAESRTLKMFIAWIITGISNQITRSDTLSRSWIIRVEKPQDGRSEKALKTEFESARGQIFGALLFFLRESIQRGPGIEAAHKINPRLYEFLVTGESISQSLGHTPGSFLAAVDERRAASARDWIKDDEFAAAVVKCVTDLFRNAKVPLPASAGSWKNWHTTPGYSVFQNGGRRHSAITAETLKDLASIAAPSLYGKPSACIPTSALGVANALDRIQNQMTLAGWTVTQRKVNGGNNTIWVFGVPL
jgi:hypothetical protein